MTTLPAYYQALEAEALAVARAFIKNHCEPNGVFHPDSDEVLKRAIRAWALHHPFGMDEIKQYAEDGWKLAHDVLTGLIAEYTARHETLPPGLGDYTIRLLNPSRQRSKPGPSRSDDFRRNIGIALLMQTLIDQLRLGATYNRAQRRLSASVIAAIALTEAGIGISMGHRGVEKVWKQFLPILAGRYTIGTSFERGIPAGYRGPLSH
jgi:hypothetical protein